MKVETTPHMLVRAVRHAIERHRLFSALRSLSLIDDLTDLSLIETGAVSLDLQVVDAGEVARDVVAQLAPRAPEIAVRCQVASPFPVLADRFCFRFVTTARAPR